jgi:molecular chaperone GrpE
MIHSSQVNLPSSREAQEYLQGWQRARAELDNFRKQVASEYAQANTRQIIQAVSAFLPLADNFRAVAEHIPKDLVDNPWAQGVLHVSRQFQDTLTQLGVEEINQTGIEFDPNQHEAIEPSKSLKQEKHKIDQIIRPGFKIGHTVIRPAQVKVK